MKNCPNCAAPLEPYKCKCEYCGTYYYDLTTFDISGNKPTYVKFKAKDEYGNEKTITALAYPTLETIESHNDYDTYIDYVDGREMYHRVYARQSATISMKFELIRDGDKLYTVEEG